MRLETNFGLDTWTFKEKMGLRIFLHGMVVHFIKSNVLSHCSFCLYSIVLLTGSSTFYSCLNLFI